MKRWTIRSSFLTSSLVKRSVIATAIVLVIMQIPILVVSYYASIARQASLLEAEHKTNDRLYVNLIESLSRFGDLVLAKGQVLQLARGRGLVDVVFCDQGVELVGSYDSNRCGDKEAGDQFKIKYNSKEIEVRFLWENLNPKVDLGLVYVWVLSSLFALVVTSLGALFTYHVIKHRLRAFSKEVESVPLGGVLFTRTSDLPEMTEVIASLNEMIVRLQEFHKVETENIAMKAVVSISNQVAHDIRSPLSALNIVSSSLVGVTEEKRSLMFNAIQRINEISNDLFKKGNVPKGDIERESNKNDLFCSNISKIESVDLKSLVENILAEKSLQYQGCPAVQIKGDLDFSQEVLVQVDSKEIKRVLSNLINNSVEALPGQVGEVIVALRVHKDLVQLCVKDNGKGIDPELLIRLGKERVTHGKGEVGSGLGIFHAKQTVEASSGRFSISSQVGVGTIVDIIFLRTNTNRDT